MKIAFIGLGIMGKPMAKNLLKAGHEVIAFDLNKENVDNVCTAGAKAASSAADAASQVPVVITMLPNSPHVKTVVCGDKGVLEGAKSGTILIDMSSIAVYCGAVGAGNTTKLANQIVVGLNIAAVAEAFTLVKKAGVDPHLVFDAIKGGLAGSTVLNAKAPMMMDGNFKPGFKIDLHIKDLANALDTGHEVGSPLPLTSLVREMMETLHADGFGQDDHSALARYYAKVSGTKIGA
jgi:2-hydroxy-3-oxopropionate reductase